MPAEQVNALSPIAAALLPGSCATITSGETRAVAKASWVQLKEGSRVRSVDTGGRLDPAALTSAERLPIEDIDPGYVLTQINVVVTLQFQFWQDFGMGVPYANVPVAFGTSPEFVMLEVPTHTDEFGQATLIAESVAVSPAQDASWVQGVAGSAVAFVPATVYRLDSVTTSWSDTIGSGSFIEVTGTSRRRSTRRSFSSSPSARS